MGSSEAHLRLRTGILISWLGTSESRSARSSKGSDSTRTTDDEPGRER